MNCGLSSSIFSKSGSSGNLSDIVGKKLCNGDLAVEMPRGASAGNCRTSLCRGRLFCNNYDAMSLDSDNVLDILAPGRAKRHKKQKKSAVRKADDEFVVDLPAVFHTDAVKNTAIYKQARAIEDTLLRQQSAEAEEQTAKRKKLSEIAAQLNQYRPQNDQLTIEDGLFLLLMSREYQFYFVRNAEVNEELDIWPRAMLDDNYGAMYESTKDQFESFIGKYVACASEPAINLAIAFVDHLYERKLPVEITSPRRLLLPITIGPDLADMKAGTFCSDVPIDGKLTITKLRLVFKCTGLFPADDYWVSCFFFVLMDTNLHNNHYPDLGVFAREIFPILVSIYGQESVLDAYSNLLQFKPFDNALDFTSSPTYFHLWYRTLKLLWTVGDKLLVQGMIYSFVSTTVKTDPSLDDCLEIAFNIPIPVNVVNFVSVVDGHYKLFAILLLLSPLNTFRASNSTIKNIIELLDCKQRQLTSQVTSFQHSAVDIPRKINALATALLQKTMAIKHQHERRTFVDIFYSE